MKSFIKTAFISIFLLTSGTGTVAAKEYSDVSSDDTFYPYINELSEEEVIQGYPDGTFRPDSPITRGELSKIVASIFDLEVNSSQPAAFSDLNENSPFYDQIHLLYSNNIIEGFSDNTFRPDYYVERGAALKFVVKAARAEDSYLFEEFPIYTIFSDVDNQNTFFEFINSATSIILEDDARIIKGYTDETFRSGNLITRGEVSKVLSLAKKYKEDGGTYLPPAPYVKPAETEALGSHDDLKFLAVYSLENRVINNTSESNINYKTASSQFHKVFSRITPDEIEAGTSKLLIFSDGKTRTLAFVIRDNQTSLNNWVVSFDIDDIMLDGAFQEELSEYVIVHEIGHIITLNTSQVNVESSLYSELSHDEFQQRQKAAAENCSTYFTIDSCIKDTSYIFQFINDFWTDKLDEWKQIDSIENEEQKTKALDGFFERYPNEFISRYAATSPEEDIAESFANFIFYEKPQSNNKIEDEKVLFFYNYPEMVNLRSQIRANL